MNLREAVKVLMDGHPLINIYIYTAPSGRHYMIFAYCYPWKTQQLYLGYAPYIIDSDHNVKVC